MTIWTSSFGYQDGEQEDSVSPRKGTRRDNFRAESLKFRCLGFLVDWDMVDVQNGITQEAWVTQGQLWGICPSFLERAIME